MARVPSLSQLILAACLLSVPARADQAVELQKPENGMYLLWSMGDLVKSRDPYQQHRIWEHEWIYELVGGLVMNSSPVDNLRLTVNFEIATYNNYPRKANIGEGEITQDTKFDPYLEEAKGVFTFGQGAPSRLQFEFGYFLMRYNHQARVFGEYLFRTMVYPAIVHNNFDYPWVPLSGLRVGHDLAKTFHHDLFLLTEFDHYPYFDFSVAYQGALSLIDMFEIGAGINFQRLIPVRPSFTTPDVPENTFVRIPAQPTVMIKDSTGAIVDSVVIAAPQEGFLNGLTRFAEVDRALRDAKTGRLHPGIQSEATVYSFQGTLVMGRASFFPMGWSQDAGRKRMLSLYTEAAVLGWKNYAGLYENRDERIPVMGGVQLALPGIIDVLALEVEHFGSKSVPSFYNRGRNNLPQPGGKYDPAPTDPAALAKEGERLTHDDWKWILYARKQFKGLALALQVGTDHMRRVTEEMGIRYDEILTRPSHWYWQVRIRIPY